MNYCLSFSCQIKFSWNTLWRTPLVFLPISFRKKIFYFYFLSHERYISFLLNHIYNNTCTNNFFIEQHHWLLIYFTLFSSSFCSTVLFILTFLPEVHLAVLHPTLLPKRGPSHPRNLIAAHDWFSMVFSLIIFKHPISRLPKKVNFGIWQQDTFCFTYFVEWKNQRNGTKFKVKMEYFEFSIRWNQAEIMIPIRLGAISIQSW